MLKTSVAERAVAESARLIPSVRGGLSGASVMGAAFALAAATKDITTARPEAVATGMRTTFAVAAILLVLALALATGSRALATRGSFHP